MDGNKSTGISRHTNVDPLDIAPFKGRPANEPMLEGINTPGIFMYADIGGMAAMGDVKQLVN